jgi:hypothetical protein
VIGEPPSPNRGIERKAPWEPRRVEGDGHVMATCGFTRPRSLYGGVAAATIPPRVWIQATDEAEEWGEVWVEDSTSLVLELGRGAGNKHNFVRQSPYLRSRRKSTE